MANQTKHKKAHPTKQTHVSTDLLDLVGYEFNESWTEAKKNTQHRPSRH